MLHPGYQIGLPPKLFSTAFPFHLVIDSRLRIIQFGAGIPSLLPEISRSTNFEKHFVIRQPKIKLDFNNICAEPDTLFLMELIGESNVTLKGQMLYDYDLGLLTFIGSPYLRSMEELKTTGLSLKDFAPHDNTPDLLFLLKSNDAALDDTKQLFSRLRQEKERAQVTLDSIGDAIIATTTTGIITHFNPVAEKLTGVAQCDALGVEICEILELKEKYNSGIIKNLFQNALNANSATELPGFTQLHYSDDNAYAVEGVIAPIKQTDGNVLGIVLVFRDVTEQRRLSSQLKYQTTHESLTKLPNRRLRHDHVDQAMRQARRRQEYIALLFLDLDRFKTINDSLGHPIGDELLKSVANRLVNIVRETDVVSRMGGDEFVVLLTGLKDPTAASIIAKKIIGTFNTPFSIETYELQQTTSIGISVYPGDGENVDTLICMADLAMYSAKQSGRNGYCFFESKMDSQASERLSMENSLRTALEQNAFQLYYQPKLDLESGKLVGMEALLRWQHPTRGFIPPSIFIPVAEEMGLIVELGKWVIGEACKQASDWYKSNQRRIPISVNVSAAQLWQNNLEEVLSESLQNNDISADLLELELTESVLMHNVDEAVISLQKLRRLGFQISIDDFGTVYSSLNYLKRFPVNTLKIDRSFIADIGIDLENTAIVDTIIKLSQTLKLKVVAEGVENCDQIECLREMGCDQIQGYIVSAPKPTSELTEYLQNRSFI